MLDKIIEATAEWNPQVYRGPCKEYPDMKPGTAIIHYKDDLDLTYEDGEFDIVYSFWIGTYKDPLLPLLMILKGYMEVQEDPVTEEIKLVTLDDDRIEDKLLQGESGFDMFPDPIIM